MSNTATVHVYRSAARSGLLVALVGIPNCGKTAVFNRLTGSRQKIANYAGVTVDRKEGRVVSKSGEKFRLLDLPGLYSLHPRAPDERVTVDALRGQASGELRPDRVIFVMDATQLARSLRLFLSVQRLGIPCVVALNRFDLATKRGISIEAKTLSALLGVPVVPCVATSKEGLSALQALLSEECFFVGERSQTAPSQVAPLAEGALLPSVSSAGTVPPLFFPQFSLAEGGQVVSALDIRLLDSRKIDAILEKLCLSGGIRHRVSDQIDGVVLHPVVGPVLLLFILFLIFQAMFSWAEWPMSAIESLIQWVGSTLNANLPEGWVRSLLVDGVIAGLGSVFVFLPQILILFFFILFLEESGYLPRAAFLLDRVMGGVGLSGRAFIPLLSSFACAIPGIMAARTIANPKDRLVTILIAPLMTCSARLPVYTLLISAFMSNEQLSFDVFGMKWGIRSQGLVLFGLYILGVLSGVFVAFVLKHFTGLRGPRMLMMELPDYSWPLPRDLLIGLWQRISIFINRVGGVLLLLTILLWFLASFPRPPEGATEAPIVYSFAGSIGRMLSFIFQPIGFNWEIGVALIPGLAAREVAVSALGTVYALSGSSQEETAHMLVSILAKNWSVATGFSLLIWYVFAPQCLSTFAAMRRETGGWAVPLLSATYLFGLAYMAAFLTYRVLGGA